MGEKMSKVNRRKFITPDGRIVETWFDVYWYAIDKNGDRYFYESKPEINNCRPVWLSETFWLQRCGQQKGKFNWKKCRWYLDDKGKWVRK